MFFILALICFTIASTCFKLTDVLHKKDAKNRTLEKAKAQPVSSLRFEEYEPSALDNWAAFSHVIFMLSFMMCLIFLGFGIGIGWYAVAFFGGVLVTIALLPFATCA